jgi:hypothetical protein
MEIPALLKNKSLIWSTVGVLILVVGIFVALQLVPKEQDIRQEAAVPTGTTQVKISPVTMTMAANEEKPATISINTMDLGIRGVSAVLSYPFTGTAPQVTAKDLTILAPFNAAPWSCGIKNIDTTAPQVIISVSCNLDAIAVPAGYKSNSQFVDLFTFNLKAGSAATNLPVVITFNNADTIMTTVNTTTGSQDIAAIPTTSLRVTVTAAPTPPPAEKKITITAPTLSCSANQFSVSATVAEGTTPKADVSVTFKYGTETKSATSNGQGIATVDFTKATTTQNVTAESTGYTTGSAAATVPTGCSSSSTNPKKLSLSLSGLGCGAPDFTAKVKAEDSTTSVLSGIGIVFTYNGETKNATTNTAGEAEVKFTRASDNKEVKAEAGAFDSSSSTATLPTNCSSSSTTTGLTCNQACSATRSCTSGLSCISGYCRVDRCSSDTSCGCADVNVAAENGTTQLPESGFDQTLAMSILGLLFLLGGGQLWWSHKPAQVSSNEEEKE